MAKSKHFGALVAAAGALVAVVLLVLMMQVLVNPQTAGAALPGTNGRIAYTGYDGNDLEIYTINANGTDEFQVTHNTVPDTQPSYSPDGNSIAYAQGNSSTPASEIVTEPATGGQIRQVNSNPLVDERGPSWTAKRNQIAFYAPDDQPGQTDWEIFTIFAEIPIFPIPNTARKVTDNNLDEAWPDYRPDGRRITFAGTDPQGTQADYEIFDVRRPTGLIWQPHQLTDNNTEDFYPVYSPDGTKIAYSGRDEQAEQTDWEIFTINLLTAGTPVPVQVTHNSTHDTEPSWQPR